MTRTGTKSMSKRLADRLRAMIVSGKFTPGARLDSIRSMAKRHNHSQPTVVRAVEILVEEGYLVTFQRKGTYVADRDAWKSMPCHIAILSDEAMPISPVHTLGVRRPHLAGVTILESRLFDAGHRISVHGCSYYPYRNGKLEYLPPRELRVDRMDALVTIGIYDLPYLVSLQELNIPIVAYDLDASQARIDSAFFDDIGSAFQLTKVLAGRGHECIGFIGGPVDRPPWCHLWNRDPCSTRREDGYRLAADMLGLEQHVLRCRWNEREEAIPKWLSEHPACTAVLLEGQSELCGDREIATWTIRKEPEWERNVSVMAVCDVETLGAATSALVVGRLEHPDAAVQRRIVAPEIVARDQ